MKPDVHVKHSNHHSSLTSHKRRPAYGTVRFRRRPAYGISEQSFGLALFQWHCSQISVPTVVPLQSSAAPPLVSPSKSPSLTPSQYHCSLSFIPIVVPLQSSAVPSALSSSVSPCSTTTNPVAVHHPFRPCYNKSPVQFPSKAPSSTPPYSPSSPMSVQNVAQFLPTAVPPTATPTFFRARVPAWPHYNGTAVQYPFRPYYHRSRVSPSLTPSK